MFRCNHRHQGAHYLNSLRLRLSCASVGDKILIAWALIYWTTKILKMILTEKKWIGILRPHNKAMFRQHPHSYETWDCIHKWASNVMAWRNVWVVKLSNEIYICMWVFQRTAYPKMPTVVTGTYGKLGCGPLIQPLCICVCVCVCVCVRARASIYIYIYTNTYMYMFVVVTLVRRS
jgi:hypothetical protein